MPAISGAWQATRAASGTVRVCHAITDLNTGGAETMLYRLVRALGRERWESSVVSLRGRGTFADPLEALGIPVRVIGVGGSAPSPRAMWRFVRECRALEPQLIQGWMYHGNLAGIVARATIPGHPPVLWGIHHALHDRAHEKATTLALVHLSAQLSRYVARIIYNSRASAAQHESLGYADRGRVIIPNGFDVARFRPSPDDYAKLRQKLRLDPAATLVGMVARFHPLKDHGTFLEAMAILRRSRPDLHVVLAGRDIHWGNSRLAREIRGRGLEAVTHLLGELSDTAPLYAGLDLACSSSSSESFPLVIGEAMSCGVPCVVTDVGDSAWIVGEHGVVVPPRSASALAAGMEQLLALSPEERRRLGHAARARIQAEFAIEGVMRQYADLYETVLLESLPA